MGCETPTEAISLFRQMMVEMELENPVAVNREEEQEMLSMSVNPVRLKNNPVELGVDVMYFIYGIILKDNNH